jgi:hypothetical protein
MTGMNLADRLLKKRIVAPSVTPLFTRGEDEKGKEKSIGIPCLGRAEDEEHQPIEESIRRRARILDIFWNIKWMMISCLVQPAKQCLAHIRNKGLLNPMWKNEGCETARKERRNRATLRRFSKTRGQQNQVVGVFYLDIEDVYR